MQITCQIGSWSRWLMDIFGMDGDDSERKGDERRGEGELNSFKLLNELSDLLMLPKDMLLENSIRKEVYAREQLLPHWLTPMSKATIC